MSILLGTKLVQEVQKQAAMNRPLPLRAEAGEVTPRGEVEARVVLRDNDRFSHLAEEITIKVASRAKSSGRRPPPSAQAKAEALCERATYLTEALGFVEDGPDGSALVRSTPATMKGRRSAYYEAKVRADEVTLRRYQPKAEGPGRDRVPFCLTDDVMSRLADDAAQALLGK